MLAIEHNNTGLGTQLFNIIIRGFNYFCRVFIIELLRFS